MSVAARYHPFDPVPSLDVDRDVVVFEAVLFLA